jgi:hypothetical protein
MRKVRLFLNPAKIAYPPIPEFMERRSFLLVFGGKIFSCKKARKIQRLFA